MALITDTIIPLGRIVRQRITDFVWRQDFDELPFWYRLLLRSVQITIAVGRDVVQGQLRLRAMSLVYATLIGFVPLLALTFSVLKSLGVHNAMEPTLLTLLEPIGERSTELTAQILSFVDNVQVEIIGFAAMGFLIYVILDMMLKIETSFNYIWEVKQARNWSSRISEYLFAVIVSPLLIFLSFGITSSVNTNYFAEFLAALTFGGLIIGFVAFIAPILFMSLAFAFAYSFLPNTRVNFLSAFIGGLLTTIIWKMMGVFFQTIVLGAARENIYLAFVPVIAAIVLAYVGWLAALIGSSVAFYHQNPAKTRNGRKQPALSIYQQEQLSLALAATVIRRFHDGEPALTEFELAKELDMAPLIIEASLDRLEDIGLVTKTNHQPPRYLPTKSVSECTVVDIWREIRNCSGNRLEENEDSPDLSRIRQFQTRLDNVIEQELGKEKFIDSPPLKTT